MDGLALVILLEDAVLCRLLGLPSLVTLSELTSGAFDDGEFEARDFAMARSLAKRGLFFIIMK